MIRLIKSTFYNEIEVKQKLCDFIMKSPQLSMEEKCLEFEEKFSKYQGRKYSVLFNSGSSANLALIQATLNLKLLDKGDNVGFSALTWSTNVMPLIQLGLNPIPIDVLLENLNVNSSNLLDVLDKTNIKILFITNLLGFCGDLSDISRICKEKNIVLLEDNCESLGSEHKGIRLGNFGLASTFSFFVGHHMSTIEGGMVCTDDDSLYQMLLMVRAHGWARNLNDDSRDKLRKLNSISTFYDQYTFYSLGYCLRPTELTGFLGVEQLKYIDEIIKKRSEQFLTFNKCVKNSPDFYNLKLDHMNLISNFAYPLICKDEESFDKYLQKFNKNQIEIRPIVGGSMVEQPFFKDFLKSNGLNYSCPNAKKIHEKGFYFPNNPELSLEEITIISNILKNGN